MPVVRPYRGVSADDRREERRARLMSACLDTVGTAGVAGTTVEAVCAAAGLSKRYFYESFDGRDDALSTVCSALFAQIRSALDAALAEPDDDVVERARAAAGAVVDTLADDPRLARLFVEAPEHPVLRVRRDAAGDEFGRLLLLDVFGTLADDPQTRLTVLIVVAGTTEAITRWLAGRVPVSRDELVTQIVAAGLAVGASLLP